MCRAAVTDKQPIGFEAQLPIHLDFARMEISRGVSQGQKIFQVGIFNGKIYELLGVGMSESTYTIGSLHMQHL